MTALPATPQTILLNHAEVALLLGISPRHVHILIRAGKLPAIRIGRRAMRVSRTDLDAFIQHNKRA